MTENACTAERKGDPGRLCANQSASLEFNGDAPHFPEDFFIAGPYFLRRDIQTDALCCKACRTIIFHHKRMRQSGIKEQQQL